MELINAAKNDDFEAAFSLLTSGYQANSRDKDNATPLYWSACRGNVQLCEMLIQAGSDVNAMVNWGSTALHAATDRGHLECVEVLVQCKADVNLQNRRGDTALHIASFRGFMEISQILMINGANLFLKNHKAKTAHEEAMGGGHTDIASYLATAMQDNSIGVGCCEPELYAQPQTGYQVNRQDSALAQQTGSIQGHYNVTNLPNSGSYCSTSLSDSPLTSEECGNEYSSYGNRSETEAVENQEDVYDTYSEFSPSDDTHNAIGHRIDVIAEQIEGDWTARTYNRQNSATLPARRWSNRNQVRRSHSVNSGCYNNTFSHESRYSENSSLTCEYDKIKPSVSLRPKDLDMKTSILCIPILDGVFGHQDTSPTKTQSYEDLRKGAAKYDTITNNVRCTSDVYPYDAMKTQSLGSELHILRSAFKNNASDTEHGRKLRNVSNSPESLTQETLTSLSSKTNDDALLTHTQHLPSPSVPPPANEFNYNSQHRTPLANSYITDNDRLSQSMNIPATSSTVPLRTNVNTSCQSCDISTNIHQLSDDLQTRLTDSRRKCENVIKENETLKNKYTDLQDLLKEMDARNDETKANCMRLKDELDKHKRNDDANPGRKVNSGDKIGNSFQESDTTPGLQDSDTTPGLQDSLTRVLRLSEEGDNERRVYINEKDLKEVLRRRFLAVPLVEVLDTPGREWTPGVDYVILGDKPISGQYVGEGGTSVTTTFSIKHIKSGRKLRLEMLLHSTHTDDCTSPQPNGTPLLLDGHSNMNIQQTLHRYNGPVERFRKFLPSVSLASRGSSNETFSLRNEIPIRASFLVTRHFPFTLPTYAGSVICNSPLDKPVSGFSFSRTSTFFLHVIYQVLSALVYLQDKGIVHRALSPDSILLDNSLRPVVCNLTHALKLTGSDNTPLQFRSKEEVVAGTQCAWAPELLYFHQTGPLLPNQIMLKNIYEKSDLYAVGQLFYCVLTGLGGSDIYFVNRQSQSRALPALPTSFPVGLRHVVMEMIRNNPGERPTIRQCMLKTGVLMCCDRQTDVVTDEGALQINMAARMLKLLYVDVPSSRRSNEDEDRTASLEESVMELHDDIEADILCNADYKDFWQTYCVMRNAGLLPNQSD